MALSWEALIPISEQTKELFSPGLGNRRWHKTVIYSDIGKIEFLEKMKESWLTSAQYEQIKD